MWGRKEDRLMHREDRMARIQYVLWTAVSMAVVSLMVMLLMGCAGIGQFVVPEQTTCDKIAYYDSYVEGAQRALIIFQFVPGCGQYLGPAAKALVLVASALDHAKIVCDAARTGASSKDQTALALDAVGDAVTNFGNLYDTLRKSTKTE
jgi:hypothetical protein